MTRQPTGRQFIGPTARLVELQQGEELWMALVLHREHRGHPGLRPQIEAGGFLSHPGVPGLLPRPEYDAGRGRLFFPTGPIWPLAQLLGPTTEQLPDRSRAALELLAQLAPLLHEAVVAAEPVGLRSHGALTPWRVLLTPEGDAQLLGYGLPALELTSQEVKPGPESYRYAPPERFSDPAEEDLTSDLFSAALMCWAWLDGRALYRGETEHVALAAQRGRARELLHSARERYDVDIIEVFDRALHLHQDSRWQDGHAMAGAVNDLLGSPAIGGPTLAELISWAADRVPDGPHTPVAAPPPRPSQAPRPARWRQTRRGQRSPPRGRPTPPKAPRVRRVPPDHNAIYPHDPVGPDAVRVKVIHQGEPSWVKLSPRETLAKSAARVVDLLEVSPVDLVGRIRGWYRIIQGEAAFYGDSPTSSLDLERPVELEWVENTPVEVRLCLEDSPEVLRAEVGLAVHGQFLVGELRRRLELEGFNWQLTFGEERLGPWQLLDDYELHPGATLTLRQTPRAHRRPQ